MRNKNTADAIKLYKVIVESTAEYGAEVWEIPDRDDSGRYTMTAGECNNGEEILDLTKSDKVRNNKSYSRHRYDGLNRR